MRIHFLSIVLLLLSFIQGQSKDRVDVDGVQTDQAVLTTNDRPNGLKAIDLGLPSGTKWANMNVGAYKPEGYGSYFAWGETKRKNIYNETTYNHYKKDSFINIGEDIAGTKYDVAHVLWGDGWRMPSKEQVDELLEICTQEWTELNGVKGLKLIGPNGNNIFLPLAGFHEEDYLDDAGSRGGYWSSTQCEWGTDGGGIGSADAYGFFLNSNSKDTYCMGSGRSCGQSIRPVTK